MRLTIVIFFLILLAGGCKDEKQPLIPYVYVNLQLYPNSLDFIPVGGYKYIDNQGYRGILVYHPLPDQFVAYERCCPYDPEASGAKITVDASSSTCTDPVCNSKYILYDGSPYSGPSPYLLMQYKCSFDGELLSIYN